MPLGSALYPMYYVAMAKICREHGYALGVHGSLGRDFDVVAVPWVQEASSEDVLIEALKTTGFMEGNPSQKDGPHGRRRYVFIGYGSEESGYIDFSVMPIR